MADDFRDVRRDISFFLLSLRRTLDRPYRPNVNTSVSGRDKYLKSMLIVEEARILFNSYTRFRAEPSAQEWKEAREGLIRFANTFIHSNEIDPSVFDRRFLATPMSKEDRDRPTAFIRLFYESVEDGRLLSDMSVGEALVAFDEYLQSASLDSTVTQGELTFAQLDRIVPRQQVAPVRFEIKNERICVARHDPQISADDRANAKSAREHLEASGEEIIANLENSNCDRRLLDKAKELHRCVVENENIVRLGLSNLALGAMGKQFESELPDAVSAMIGSYCTAASLYVAQFPEWEQFTQNAAAVELDDDDLAEVDATAGEIIEMLERDTQLSEPEVPQTISLIRDLMSTPGKTSKRAAFAMLRTVENLVSSIVRFGVGLVAKTAEKTVEAGSSIASKIIVGLLSVALAGASGIGNAAMTAGAPWVKQAAEIVQKQITKFQN